MDSRAKRLGVVLELAQQAENTAAEIYNKARSQHRQELQKLENLAAYCEDYQGNLDVVGSCQSVDAIARSRGFLSQLVNAKKQQQQIVHQFLILADQKKHHWHKAHHKHHALKELIQRLNSDHQKALSRQEEKLLDEWVTMGFARRNSETN